MSEVATVRETVKRLKADGLPVSEYTLRRWLRTGVIPFAPCGSKALIFYPNVVNYIKCGQNIKLPTSEVNGIRRVEV